MRKYYDMLSDMASASLAAQGEEQYRKIEDVTIHVKYSGAFDYLIRVRNGFERAESFTGMDARENAAERILALIGD